MVMNQWYEIPTWFLQDNILTRYYLPFNPVLNASAEIFHCARITVFSDNTLDFDIGNFKIPVKQVIVADNMYEVFVHNNLIHKIIIIMFNWRP